MDCGSAAQGVCPAELLEAHRPLLLSLVSALHVERRDQEDAQQAAALGFLVAFQRFDANRAVPIGVYARGFIKQEVRRATGWLRGVPPRFTTLDEDLDAETDDAAEEAFSVLEVDEEYAAVRAFVAGLSPDDSYLYQRLFVDQVAQAVVAQELGLTPMQLTRRKQAFLARARMALAPMVLAA